MERYVIDSGDAKRNQEGYVCGFGSISYTAVIGTPVFSNEDDTEPVDIDLAKQHCRIDGTDDDDYIEMLITAAREQCEAYANLSFVARTVTAKVRAGTRLPYGPVESYTGIKDIDGTTVTGAYKDLSEGIYVVTYNTLPPDPMPSRYKTAVLNQVAYLYEHRGDESSGELSPGTKAILKPIRIV